MCCGRAKQGEGRRARNGLSAVAGAFSRLEEGRCGDRSSRRASPPLPQSQTRDSHVSRVCNIHRHGHALTVASTFRSVDNVKLS